MQSSEFNSQINRLISTFGKSVFGDERIRLIWERVDDLSSHWFESVVSEFIGSFRQAPLLPDFREKEYEERERIWKARDQKAAQRDWNAPVACDICRDTGVYVCANESREGRWGFRCHCAIGMRDPRKHPQFKQRHADDGFVYYDVTHPLRKNA